MNVFNFDLDQFGAFLFYMFAFGANFGLILYLIRMMILTWVERRSA